MCDDAEVCLEYLPPYSPDFNPIEEAFAELKAWIKKNYLLVDNYETFDGFLDVALRQLSQKPGNHFRSCHIDMK
jgi:transposase